MSFTGVYGKGGGEEKVGDAAPLLDNNSSGTYNTGATARMEISGVRGTNGAAEKSNDGKTPDVLRNKACTLLAAFGTFTLTFVAIYILADAEGRYIILAKGDTRETRTWKAIQVFLAALVYLAIGVYNYKKWKMKEVGGAACGDNGSYLPLS